MNLFEIIYERVELIWFELKEERMVDRDSSLRRFDITFERSFEETKLLWTEQDTVTVNLDAITLL